MYALYTSAMYWVTQQFEELVRIDDAFTIPTIQHQITAEVLATMDWASLRNSNHNHMDWASLQNTTINHLDWDLFRAPASDRNTNIVENTDIVEIV